MWPWGHAALGYLCYTFGIRAQGEAPNGLPVIALAIGTQFPDLVDKPLGWTLGVLPGGRSLAHSLLTLAVVAAVVGYAARRYRRSDVGVAFLVGYLTHVLSDGLYSAIEGAYGNLTYLLWPVLPMPEPEIAQTFWAHFAQASLDSYMALELGLVALSVIGWWVDGRPGLSVLRSTGERWLSRLAGPEDG